MPIHHITIKCTDVSKLASFYQAALAPLGYKETRNFQDGKVRGYSDDSGPGFWLRSVSLTTEGEEPLKPSGPVHVAFNAKSHDEVKAFYNAAIAAGGICNGPPGPRPQYTSNYYGAFVLDPEGHNIEALCLTEQVTEDAPTK